MRIPTKKIAADNRRGYIIINESDFDPSKHKEFIPSKGELLKEAKELGVEVGGRAKPETIASKIEEAKNKIGGLLEEDA